MSRRIDVLSTQVKGLANLIDIITQKLLPAQVIEVLILLYYNLLRLGHMKVLRKDGDHVLRNGCLSSKAIIIYDNRSVLVVKFIIYVYYCLFNIKIQT